MTHEDPRSDPRFDDARHRLLLAYAYARGRGLTAVASHMRDLGAAQGLTARDFDEVAMLEGLVDRALDIDAVYLTRHLGADAAPDSRRERTAHFDRRVPVAPRESSPSAHEADDDEWPRSGLDPGRTSAITDVHRTDSGGIRLARADEDAARAFLGPFEILASSVRPDGGTSDSCLDAPTGRAIDVRRFGPSRLTTTGHSRLVERLSQLATTTMPWPAGLQFVAGVDHFTHQPAVGRNPAHLRRLKGGQFGILEEPLTNATPLAIWLTLRDRASTDDAIRADLAMVRALAESLRFLERYGLAHGALTERSIVCLPDGTPRLIDWAWAALVLPPREERPENASNTAAWGISAHTCFLAPEVFIQEEEGRGAADQYALGVLLYRLVTGALPPEWVAAGNFMGAVQAIEQGIVTRPRDVNRTVSPALEAIVLRAAAVRPEDRFASVAELCDALDDSMHGVARDIVLGVPAAPRAESPSARLPFSRAAPRPPSDSDIDAALTDAVPPAYQPVRVVSRRRGAALLEVRHRQTSARFALKLALRQDDAEADALVRRQFEVEHQSLSRCQHDSVITLQEAGTVGPASAPYLVLEWALGWDVGDEGEDACVSLHDVARPLPEPVVVWIGQQLTRALEVCHDRGVVHYDVKPSNLLCFPRGQVKLTDFSLANYPHTYAEHLDAGRWLGSPPYMAPERLTEPLTQPRPESDLFAVGVTLYELLTGRRPYPEHEKAIAAHEALPSFDPPPDPRETVDCSRRLSRVVRALIAADGTSRRLRSASKADGELRAVLAEPVAWTALTPHIARRADAALSSDTPEPEAAVTGDARTPPS